MMTLDAYLSMLVDDPVLQSSITLAQQAALKARLAVVIEAVRGEQPPAAPAVETASVPKVATAAAPASLPGLFETDQRKPAAGNPAFEAPAMAPKAAGPFFCAADGACSGNGTDKAAGGWAAVFHDGRAFKGNEPAAGVTNNRMEIMAAIAGLSAVEPGSEITMILDSEYVINTMTKNWKTKVNHDLWAQLKSLAADRSVSWVWTKGHTGRTDSMALELNDKADRLAQEQAQLIRR